mmetsp:Transcript_29691/g.41002  ORF Transcript_29691/g.41002 Transcript_29691/m.41002 type:complete len:413 (+) Transcript_29691:48-1286(+)
MGIPVNIITGALGVGKTTAIRYLLQNKPADEHWAVLVNEFGALGIDGPLINEVGSKAGSPVGLTVKEVAGGCMCCAQGMPLTVVIAQLIRQARPQRLLVEPSGLGHPAALVDILQNEHLRGSLDLRAVICLVDPHTISSNPELVANEGFINQVSISDVLVCNKVDLAADADLQAFDEWSRQIYPPKTHICSASQGHLEGSWLNFPFSPSLEPLATHPRRIVSFALNQSPEAPAVSSLPPPPPLPPLENNAEHSSRYSAPANATTQAPTSSQPVRQTQSSGGQCAAGWLFCPEDKFDHQAILTLLTELHKASGVARCKGIFHVGKEWFSPTWKAGECENIGPVMCLEPVAYRHDSRIEIIHQNPTLQFKKGPGKSASLHEDASFEEVAIFGVEAACRADWDCFESALLRCLQT